jgi:hypothetical protein
MCTVFAATITAWIGTTFVHDPTCQILQSLPVTWESHMGNQLIQFITFFTCFIAFFALSAFFNKRLRGLL